MVGKKKAAHTGAAFRHGWLDLAVEFVQLAVEAHNLKGHFLLRNKIGHNGAEHIQM